MSKCDKVFYAAFWVLDSLCLAVRTSLYLLVQGGVTFFTWEIYFLLFGDKRRIRVFLHWLFK